MSYNGGAQGYYPQGGGQGYVRSNGGGYSSSRGGGGGNRKRGRTDDDYYNNQQSQGQDYNRRRYNERGDYGHHQRRGGGGGGYRQAPIPFKSPLEEFQDELWQLGQHNKDTDPAGDIPILAQSVRRQWERDSSAVLEVVRVALRDLPHKVHHYAALVALLSLDIPDNKVEQQKRFNETAEAAADNPVELIGRVILKDLSKALQQYADERRWRSARLLLFTFAALTDLGETGSLVSVASVLSTLDAHRKVLDEPELSAARGDECVRTIVETLLRLGPSIEGTQSFKDAVSSYLANRKIERDLLDKASYQAQWEDPIEILISALSSDSSPTATVTSVSKLVDLKTLAGADAKLTAFDLPTFTVPPELGNETLTATSVPEASSGLLGNEGIGHEPLHLTLRLFDDDSVPTAYDPAGTVIRSLIADVVAIYDINRKDGAAILLDLARWMEPGLFKDKDVRSSNRDVEPRDWSLESLIVEAILSSVLALPQPPKSEAYYYALLGELCRLSPQTVAPPLGKCIRKLYAGLGAEAGQTLPVLDADGVRRFAEWFAIHLSNFNFTWGWKDWAADMEVGGPKHPKRVFVTHTIALEVRLSYFDRVKGTIPPDMIKTGVMPDEAPGPVHAYESDAHEHHTAAAQLEKSMRLKSSIREIEDELEAFQKTLTSESRVSHESQALAVARDMFASTLLFIGSRSFSHFLNILERYLPVVRTHFGSTRESKEALLDIVARFWTLHPQFRQIAIQKLVQYRIVEPVDVVRWLLELPSSAAANGEEGRPDAAWHDPNTFELLRSTLRTSMTRLQGARTRLTNLRNEREQEKAARLQPQNQAQSQTQEAEEAGDKIEVDQDEQTDPDSRAANQLVNDAKEDLTTVALKSLALFARKVDEAITVDNDVDDTNWDSWWIEGWFRELCRFLGSGEMDRCLGYDEVRDAVKTMDLDTNGLASTILSSAQNWVDHA